VFLRPVDEAWQPSDLLPDMKADGWRETLAELQKRSAQMTDELLVVLIGNLVTEEALPSYQTWLNRADAIKDQTGVDDTAWALWSRGWTAEENRHGEVLNKYLYLTGRVDMHAFEITVHHLIRNGFDLKSGNDPYKSLVYASFQERATKISHANAGKLAEKCGEAVLGNICSVIAGDEARHEEVYKRFVAELFRIDPRGAIKAFALMMRQKIAMPARLMADGSGRDIFAQFAIVAQKSGIYTTRDYADVIAHLVDYWKVGSLRGLTGDAAAAQEFLCGLAEHYLSKADRIEEILPSLPPEPFRWIFDRCV